MGIRICKACKTLIRSDSLFFCYNCGSELTRSHGEHGHKELGSSNKRAKINRSKSKINFPSVFFSLFAVLVFAGIFVLSSRVFKNDLSQEVEKNDSVRVSEDIIFTSEDAKLGTGLFADLIPANTSLFVEITNIEELYGAILANGLLRGLSLRPAGYASFFGFSDGNWGIIFGSLKEDPVPKEGLYYESVRGNTLITNSEELITRVKEASNDLVLNLSLTPDYIRAKRNITRDGQLWILKLSDGYDDLLSIFLLDKYLKVDAKSYIISQDGIFSILD